MDLRLISLCLLMIVSVCAGIKTSNDFAKHATKYSQDGEAWCEVCVLVMERVGNLIKEKESDGKINETLHGVCDMIRGNMRKECYELIPEIESELTKGIDPKKACEMIRLYGDENASNIIKAFATKMAYGAGNPWEQAGQLMRTMTPHVEQMVMKYSSEKITKSGSSLPCIVCKTLVGMIDKSLEPYKDYIVKYVLGICNDLPSPTNKACSDAMGYYIPVWWDEFFKDIASAKKICYMLSLCKDNSKK